ncbi:MAG: adenylate/guanylate cyclase domain-containing protein, partial [Rhodococcus sp. (in: high G+C Gram-positive bacteria)]
MLSMLLSNLFGAVLVFAFVRYGLPLEESQPIVADRVRNVYIFGAYLVLAGAISLYYAAVMLRTVVRWQLRGGPPTRREQMTTLHAPLRQAIVHSILWVIGGFIFVILTVSEMPSLAVAVIVTVVMAATVTFG